VVLGSYEVWLGLDVPETVVRIAARQDDQLREAGRVLLGTIDFSPTE
jgi:hypothetical protein